MPVMFVLRSSAVRDSEPSSYRMVATRGWWTDYRATSRNLTALLDAQGFHFLALHARESYANARIFCEHLPANCLAKGRPEDSVGVPNRPRRQAALEHPGVETLDVNLTDRPSESAAQRRANVQTEKRFVVLEGSWPDSSLTTSGATGQAIG